jgi:hypothetical protein
MNGTENDDTVYVVYAPTRQVPATHASPVAQTVPQVPQLLRSLKTFEQVWLAPQRISPAAHGVRHIPITQVRSGVHIVMHPPQC